MGLFYEHMFLLLHYLRINGPFNLLSIGLATLSDEQFTLLSEGTLNPVGILRIVCSGLGRRNTRLVDSLH